MEFLSQRPVVCIQGLGFVGTAMALAVANARTCENLPAFNVIGVELDNENGRSKVAALNSGRVPISSNDPQILQALTRALETKNFLATTDQTAYSKASVTVVDIHLDVNQDGDQPRVSFENLSAAIKTVCQQMPANGLILIETTVPPGTCEKVIAPLMEKILKERGLDRDAIGLAHSYERVMPGDQYFDSIVNYWRVYAGNTPAAAAACEKFLSQFINVRDYPLTRLDSTTASETAKVLENSYRATTIAFMEEWGRFAEAVKIDIFQVVEAIRKRPTHSGIRQPGFGVGGYCLTKDPLLAWVGARDLFNREDLNFPFCRKAVSTNQAMPLVTLEYLEGLLGSLKNKNILLMGVSYRQDVGDTRYSPSETFAKEAIKRGARITAHDPLVQEWPELSMEVAQKIPSPNNFDAVVFAVQHKEYRKLNFKEWLLVDSSPVIFDANNVLNDTQNDLLSEMNVPHSAIGRGMSL